MIAGTLAVLDEPADEPLSEYIHDRGFPALAVGRTQQALDGAQVQTATAAARVNDTATDVFTGRTHDTNDVYVDADTHDTTTAVTTELVCDATNTGIVLAESVYGDDDTAFPFDVVWNVAERKPVRQRVAVSDLHAAWSRDDVLGDVWMTGADSGDGARIAYHDRADDADVPTIGLGFERPWDGTAVKGVVFASGYIALYSASSASRAVRFIADELLPYCSDDEEGGGDGQASVSDFGGDDE